VVTSLPVREPKFCSETGAFFVLVLCSGTDLFEMRCRSTTEVTLYISTGHLTKKKRFFRENMYTVQFKFLVVFIQLRIR
jgi:hypothetical protein